MENNTKKIEIVRTFLTEKPASKSAFAVKFGISVRTLGRYVESFGAAVSEEMAKQVEPKSAMDRKYKVRSTGFIQTVYNIFSELGSDAPTEKVLVVVLAKRKNAGLPYMSKASAAAMISNQRKMWKKDHNIG